MAHRQSLLSARRPRYVVYAAMVVTPIIAVAVSSWLIAARQTVQDETSLRASYRLAAEDVGRAALNDTLEPLELALRNHVRSTAERELRMRALEQMPLVTACSPARIAQLSRSTPHQALAEARRLELVAKDFPGALDEYRRILGDGPEEARKEASAGTVAALHALGRDIDAAVALRSALDARTIGADAAAALAIELCEHARPFPDLSATVVAAADHALHELGACTLTDRLLALASGIPGSVAEHERLALIAASRERVPSAIPLVPIADAKPTWRSVDHRIFAVAAGAEFAVEIDRNGLCTAIERIIAQSPALAGLAATYRQQYGRDISGESGAQVAIQTPWQQTLLVVASPRLDGTANAPISAAKAIAAALCVAIVLIIAGLALLARAARREVEAARERADFASAVSHELKTPLSLISMFAETISLGYARDEAHQRECAAIIVDESRRLGLLIANVLEAAAIERGVRSYVSAPLDLGALVREVVETHRQRLESAGFAVSVTAEPILVAGDRDALLQAVLNLLDNAMKYSPTEKSVAVDVRTAEGRVTLSVADRGIGIAKRDLERIFRPFVRGSDAGNCAKGVGLGLSIVSAIARAHGGSLTVASEPGRGSVFTIELPQSLPSGKREAA
jgi:signal transduction histidine kinase